MKKLLIFALAFGFAAGSMTAESMAGEDADEAIAFVEELSAEVLDTLQEDSVAGQPQTERLHGLLRRGLDVPGIGRFVLGSHWNDATPQQIAEYQSLFDSYLLNTYSRTLLKEKVEGFSVTASQPTEDGDVLVHTQFQLSDGKPKEWAWRVRDVDGEQRIVDLFADGVSMAVTYRSEFGAVVGSRGLDGLLDALRRKQAQSMAPASTAEAS